MWNIYRGLNTVLCFYRLSYKLKLLHQEWTVKTFTCHLQARSFLWIYKSSWTSGLCWTCVYVETVSVFQPVSASACVFVSACVYVSACLYLSLCLLLTWHPTRVMVISKWMTLSTHLVVVYVKCGGQAAGPSLAFSVTSSSYSQFESWGDWRWWWSTRPPLA